MTLRLVATAQAAAAALTLDDLLYLLAAQIRRLQDQPSDTLRLSIKRTFDTIQDRLP